MKVIDLHMHSWYSDGENSPSQLIQMAKHSNVQKIALTDHNTIEGMEEFNYFAQNEGIEAINGVEIDSFCPKTNKKVHVLGYDFKDLKGLQEGLKVVNEIRNRSIKNYIFMFNHIGIPLTIEEIKSFNCSNYINEFSIARVVESKTKMTLPEIRIKYFSNNIGINNLNLQSVIDIIKDCGGIAVFAHPGETLRGFYQKEYSNRLLSLYKFDGIEAIYPTHGYEQMQYYIWQAKRNNLLITCGSDYHRKSNIQIGGVCNHKYIDIINKVSIFK